MRQVFFSTVVAVVLGGIGAFVSAQDGALRESAETAAEHVQAATATIRISCPKKAEEQAAEKPADQNTDPRGKGRDGRHPCSIFVCTGVCVAKNKIVTAVPVGSNSQIRLTFPGGKQDDARLRVVDEFSGLVLLDSPKCAARPLELAEGRPAAGSTVITAAAWGVEMPLVLQGMVSGRGHALAGSCFPPLIVCQLPAAETSSGAAVVDRNSKLVGIVVGVDPAQANHGWMTYAVPVSHVQRLLRACEESEKLGRRDTVIVLKRRRGVVGWKLESDGDEAGIVVRQITEGGPAAKAGIRTGDRVLAVDGIQIRSIYQAWSPTFCKQAGDTLTYRIQRGEKTQELTVVLGGEVEVDSLPAEKLPEFVQQKLEFGRDEQGEPYFKSLRRARGETGPSVEERIKQLEAENKRLQEEVLRLQGKSPPSAETSP